MWDSYEQEEFERGVRDGSKATATDQFIKSLFETFSLNSDESAYARGYKIGVEWVHDYEEGQLDGSRCKGLGAAFQHDVTIGFRSEAYLVGFKNGYENQPQDKDDDNEDCAADEEEECEVDDNESGTSCDYVPQAYHKSTSPPVSSRDPLIEMINLGVLVTIITTIFHLTGGTSGYPTSNQTETMLVQETAQPAPLMYGVYGNRTSDAVPPWPNSILLDPNLDERSHLTWVFHENFEDQRFELSLDQIHPVSEPLRYAGREVPRQGVLSQASISGRYQFVTLCDLDWCDDVRLIDRKRRAMVQVSLSDLGATQGVSWSPDERFVLAKWAHAGQTGFVALDLETLQTTRMDEGFLISIFGDESGDIDGPPDGDEPSFPTIEFDVESVEWLGSNPDVLVKGNVNKIKWSQDDEGMWVGNYVVTEQITIRFSVPSLEGSRFLVLESHSFIEQLWIPEFVMAIPLLNLMESVPPSDPNLINSVEKK